MNIVLTIFMINTHEDLVLSNSSTFPFLMEKWKRDYFRLNYNSEKKSTNLKDKWLKAQSFIPKLSSLRLVSNEISVGIEPVSKFSSLLPIEL